MNSLFIALSLFALLSVTTAISFITPQTCYYPPKISCVGGNKTCTAFTSCIASASSAVQCSFCKSGLYCNSGVCSTDVAPGAPCGVSGSTAPCYDNSLKGYAYTCATTGNSPTTPVCTGYPGIFSAGEGGCSTSSFNAATGGCDYGQSCNSGTCSIATGNNCTTDGECGPNNYCSSSKGGCQPRLSAGGDCSTDHNACQFNLVAHIPQGSSTCTCTSLFSLPQGAACNDPFVCSTGFCNQTSASPTCQPAGLNSGKSCATDADCVPANADYFPPCECGSSHGTSVTKGQCAYLGIPSSDRTTIAAVANCEVGVDYGVRPDASHLPGDAAYYQFDGFDNEGPIFPHYYPGSAVDNKCGATIRKYLSGACGSAASIPQVLSALFALAIAVALLF